MSLRHLGKRAVWDTFAATGHIDEVALAKAANSWEGSAVPSTDAIAGTGGPAHDQVPQTGQYANWLSRGGRTKPTPPFQRSTPKAK